MRKREPFDLEPIVASDPLWEPSMRERYAQLYADNNPPVWTYPSQPAVTGSISQDTYAWAIGMIQLRFEYLTSPDDHTSTDKEHTRAMIEHARWIIDRVHDGTLEIKA